MIQEFRKKSVVVWAIQWNGNSNKAEIEKFVGKELKCELESETAYVAGKGAPIFSLFIETKEGTMKAFRGDWIIKEPFPTGDRDFYPCKNDIFVKTYETVRTSKEDFRGEQKIKNIDSAKEYLKERFGEYPKDDSEKLAVVMMTEYALHLKLSKNNDTKAVCYTCHMTKAVNEEGNNYCSMYQHYF